jgi:hypothetical protein
VFGDGLRCLATTPLVRLAATTAAGGEFVYQIWYRNQPAGYCTPLAFNLSNGLRITWP